jgi:putative (di)nucleoside polyphosphate hydrolase
LIGGRDAANGRVVAPLYRRNVAAILQDGQGKILVAERNDIPGAWQFPQGGVDEGESDDEALAREVREEIGLPPRLYEVLQRRGGYRYLFPDGRLKYGKYHGQEQVYFLCRFLGQDSDIDLEGHSAEFARVRWLRPDEFDLAWVPPFKREVFAAVFRDFFGVEFPPVSR